MEEENFEEIAKETIRNRAEQHLRQECFPKYGIEGTLEKIEELYKNMPGAKDYLIETFWMIVKGDIK